MTETVVARYEPGFDYFPHKVGFRHSNQLAAEYHGHYKRVRLVTNGVGEEFRFVFVQRGTPAPRVEPDDVVIHVPIERFSLGSYRYGGASDVLGVVDRIVGFGNHTHVTTPSIQRLFETGRLQRNFDLEAIANRGTEAHFNWYATSSLSALDDAVERMGSLVIPAAEHMEPTTLARAEWVKFFAMFFNKEAEATRSSTTSSGATGTRRRSSATSAAGRLSSSICLWAAPGTSMGDVTSSRASSPTQEPNTSGATIPAPKAGPRRITSWRSTAASRRTSG
jgi:hypothetical protein